MQTNDAAPHHCPRCGQTFLLHRDTTGAKPPFPSDWHLDVAHVHGENGKHHWEAIVYYRKKGQRIPAVAKAIAQEGQKNRRALIERKQIDKASRR